MSAIDVGDKVSTKAFLCIRLESLGDHHGTQVGTTDTNVDDVSHGLAGVALPFTRADCFRKFFHVCKDFADLGHNILTLVVNRLVTEVSERNMQHSTVFGEVDVFASEHLVAHFINLGFLGKLKKEEQSFIGDTVLGKVKEDGRVSALKVAGVLFKALRILLEEFLDNDLLTFEIIVLLELLPGVESVGKDHDTKVRKVREKEEVTKYDACSGRRTFSPLSESPQIFPLWSCHKKQPKDLRKINQHFAPRLFLVIHAEPEFDWQNRVSPWILFVGPSLFARGVCLKKRETPCSSTLQRQFGVYGGI